MRELQKRQKVKSRIYSLPVLILLLILLVVFTKAAWGAFGKQQATSQYVHELEQEVTTLSMREQELRANIDRLQTPEGLDEEIKEKFSVSREGEHVAVIVDTPPSATEEEVVSQSWWQKLWSALWR